VGKPTTLIYYGSDTAEATRIAVSERSHGRIAMTRDASRFDGQEEPCDWVVVMPEVPWELRQAIAGVYGERVEPPAVNAQKPREKPRERTLTAAAPRR
jgi:hypothetical protein